MDEAKIPTDDEIVTRLGDRVSGDSTADVTRTRPVIVCLCGSTRFYDAFQQANYELTLIGQIVLSIGVDTKSDTELLKSGELQIEQKVALDELHKRKIDLADWVLVLNVGGYIGESTWSEIEYAEAHGKPVKYLIEPDRGLPLHRTEAGPPGLCSTCDGGGCPDCTDPA